MRLFVFLVVSVTLPMSANAAYWTGNQMHEACKDSELTDGYVSAAALAGFVAGALDQATRATYVMEALEASSEPRVYQSAQMEMKGFCVPSGAIIKQVVDIVCTYVGRRPERRHLAAVKIVDEAVAEAWSCPTAPQK